MKRFFLPAIILILVLIGIVYYNAGGFNEVEVKEAISTPQYIIGKSFEGNVKDEGFSSLFADIESLKKDNNIEGHLGGVYYNNPASNKGNIKAFLGVITNEKGSGIDGFEWRELPSISVLVASTKASNVFGISINKVYSAIFKHAEDHSIELEEHYVEWFPSPDEVVVQIKMK